MVYYPVMKFTFTGQYHLSSYPLSNNGMVNITLYAKSDGRDYTIMIEDKDIRKTTISSWNPRHMTVHKDFYISSSNTITTAEQERNQRMSNPNVNYGQFRSQSSKEVLCGIYERDLVVDTGTFDKIIKIFNLFPDQVELLFD